MEGRGDSLREWLESGRVLWKSVIGPPEETVLQIRSGLRPEKCEYADAGEALATMPAPDVFLQDPMSAKPVEATAEKSGRATYFRVYSNDMTTCHMQGSVSNRLGGGDIGIESLELVAGERFSIALVRPVLTF